MFVDLFLRPSSRLLNILIADGNHDIDETFVRVNGVEEILLFLRGYPEIFLTNGGIMAAIYDGTIPLLILCIKYIFCWFLLTDRLIQPHLLYNLTNDTYLVSPVTMLAASFCIFCKV